MCVQNFIYLFLAVLSPHCCAGLFSSCVRASHCSGFSCCRVRAVGVRASVVAVHGHSSGGCLTPGHKFSCSLAWGIFLDQGSNLSPPLAGTFFTAEPPGKPCAILFIHSTSPQVIHFTEHCYFCFKQFQRNFKMRGSLILPTHLIFRVFFISLWKSRFPFVTSLLPSEGLLTVLWCRTAITDSQLTVFILL